MKVKEVEIAKEVKRSDGWWKGKSTGLDRCLQSLARFSSHSHCGQANLLMHNISEQSKTLLRTWLLTTWLESVVAMCFELVDLAHQWISAWGCIFLGGVWSKLSWLLRLYPQFSPISNWIQNTRKLAGGRFISTKCLMDLTVRGCSWIDRHWFDGIIWRWETGLCQMEVKEQMMERKPRPFHPLHNAHWGNTI